MHRSLTLALAAALMTPLTQAMAEVKHEAPCTQAHDDEIFEAKITAFVSRLASRLAGGVEARV